jgi:hypothetical protein
MAYIGTNPSSAPAVFGGPDWRNLPGLLAQLGQPYPQSNPVHQQLGQVQELVQQLELVQVLERLLSYRKLPKRKLQR